MKFTLRNYQITKNLKKYRAWIYSQYFVEIALIDLFVTQKVSIKGIESAFLRWVRN